MTEYDLLAYCENINNLILFVLLNEVPDCLVRIFLVPENGHEV